MTHHGIIGFDELMGRLRPGQRLLGIDLGTRTIGLALSDTLRAIASPLTTLRRGKFGRDAAALEALFAEHDIGACVIGLPVQMDGLEGARAQSTRAFVRNMAARGDMGFLLWDERLSTTAVTRTLLEADASRKRRAELVDKMAAAYILQGALDRLKGLGAAC